MTDTYRCVHCKSENLRRHCEQDCGWATCGDCAKTCVLKKEEA